MPRRTTARAGTLVALLPLSVGAVFSGLAVAQLMPRRVLDSPVIERAAALGQHALPQGWSFFTKSPLTPRYRLYAVRDDRLTDVVAEHAADASNAYGLNRTFRNAAAEREAVERLLADADLTECPNGDLARCVEPMNLSTPEYRMRSSMRDPAYCGAFYVGVGEPVPWEWRGLVEGAVRTTHVTTVEIACDAR